MNSTRFANLKECYRVLNLPEGAEWSQVRKTYHQLARKYHPDRQCSANSINDGKFKTLSSAFEMLQKHYRKTMENTLDSHSLVPVDGSLALQMDSWADSPPTEEFPATHHELKPEGTPWTRRLGEALRFFERKCLMLDVPAEVQIDRETAHKGGVVRVRISGESFYVRVPAGMKNEFSVRIPDRGETGLLSSRRGDLLLKVRVTRNPARRNNKDVYHKVRVSRRELSQNKVFSLETSEGTLKYNLPKIAISGQAIPLPVAADSPKKAAVNHIVILDLV